MSSLQQKRQILEEIDVIEAEISKRLRHNPLIYNSVHSHNVLGGRKRPLKETLLQQNEVKLFIKQLQKQSQVLSDHLQKCEPETDINLQKFDELYKNLQKFHDKYPDRPIDDPSLIYLMYSSGPVIPGDDNVVEVNGKKRRLRRPILSSFAANLNLDEIFTEEENYGNFLDLIIFHQKWLNLPGNDIRFSYTDYLDNFNKLPYPNNINLKLDKGSQLYIEYITSLAQYLKDFIIKTLPLGKPHVSINRIEQNFEEKWASDLQQGNEFIDNDKKNKYKINEQDKSVNCLICDKNFTKFTVYKGHLQSKKHLKNLTKLGDDAVSTVISPVSSDDVKTILKSEFEIRELSQLLQRQISSTRTNVERKKLLTEHERDLEIASLRKKEEDEIYESSSDENEDDENDSDNEGANYSNPLKLPLGIDGKPIPYWLFKLNGLGLEFQCEVCGNFVYQGRKSYNSHFGEAKHLNGLKCLGIDTSLVSVFKGISKIEDVLKLRDKMNLQNKRESTLMENFEEVEDDEGNVMSRRDYEDLKKQGLV